MARPAPAPARARLRLPIGAALSAALGGLVFVAVTGVLFLTLSTAADNTLDLLQDKARLAISAVATRTREHLEPAGHQLDYVAGLIERGEVAIEERARMHDILGAALAGAPQVEALVLLDVEGGMIAARRTPAAASPGAASPGVGSWQDQMRTITSLAQADLRAGEGVYWTAPSHVAALGGSGLSAHRPVTQNGELIGLLIAVVPVRELSEFVAETATEFGQQAFLLYDRERVLAHQALAFGFEGLGPDRPLPLVTEVGDPVLFLIWREGWQDRSIVIDQPGHWDRLGGTEYVFIYEELDGFADRPLLAGSYFGDEGGELARLMRAAGLGLLALVVAVVAALAIGHMFARSIRQLAGAALAVRDLDFEGAPQLPRSRLREIDEAATAFNAMVNGLAVFARYVPRGLVLRLMRKGEVDVVASEIREVSVLFTDITGFTALAERMGGAETADFLNAHFRLVTACIESEDGTVDKFIGDAVMAFWNAPEPWSDHAARAIRAAAAIARAIERDNDMNARAGRPPLGVRIGVHSGAAVVGHIGAPSRMNYTIVGDTVNAAQRLEELAPELVPEAPVVALASAEAVAAAGDAVTPAHSLGHHRLRGRLNTTEIFRIA